MKIKKSKIPTELQCELCMLGGLIPSRFTETSFMDVKTLPNLHLYVPETVWRGFFFLTPKEKIEKGSFWFLICIVGELKKQKFSLLLCKSVPGAARSKRGTICLQWSNSDHPQKERKGRVLGHTAQTAQATEKRGQEMHSEVTCLLLL